MKRLVLMIIPAIVCGALFAGCSSEKAGGIDEEATFSGTFTATYFSPGSNNSSGNITLTLSDGKHISVGALHEQAKFSGNYTIDNDKIIIEMNVWKTDYIDKSGNIIAYDFDTFIIPQGECTYTLDGNTLKLSRTVEDFGYYEWNLVKQ